MRDKPTDAIRIGIVDSINTDKATARVHFEDRQGVDTADLFVTVPKTLKDHYYYMPDIGERVRVVMDPEAPTKGCVMGSYYCDGREPPIKDPDKAYVQFMDKTLLEYDRSLHKLTIHILAAGDKSIEVETASDITVKTNGRLVVEAAKDIDIESGMAINVKASTDINIQAGANVNINAKGDMNLEASGDMTLKAANIHLNP